jgi:uncharacterized membrane protein (DUF373 family)
MDNASQPTNYNAGVVGILDKAEAAIYLLVALFLGVMALMTFFLVARDLSQFAIGQYDLNVIDAALNSLLVTLIIAALIQTVIVYIKIHTLDLRMILGVGLTAMIRRVLVFGIEKTITWEQMAVTALLILVIIIGIYLVGDKKASRVGNGSN